MLLRFKPGFHITQLSDQNASSWGYRGSEILPRCIFLCKKAQYFGSRAQHINHPKFGIFSVSVSLLPRNRSQTMFHSNQRPVFFFSPGNSTVNLPNSTSMRTPNEYAGMVRIPGSMKICRFKSFDPKKKRPISFNKMKHFQAMISPFGWKGW